MREIDVYRLLVCYHQEVLPRDVVSIERADAVLDRIPDVLAEHRDCEKLVVMLDGLRLFAIDSSGARLP